MKKTETYETPDRVFVLRFWQQTGVEPAAWRGEVKELGTTRQADRRYAVSGLASACRLIGRQLRKTTIKE